MSSKFFDNKHNNEQNASRGPQSKKQPNQSARANQKRLNSVKKSGRGK